jgi:hypothetical protein
MLTLHRELTFQQRYQLLAEVQPQPRAFLLLLCAAIRRLLKGAK